MEKIGGSKAQSVAQASSLCAAPIGRKHARHLIALLCAVIAFWCPQTSLSQGPVHGQPQPSEWRPTQAAESGASFAGDNTCAKCHADKAASYEKSGMAKALSSAAESSLLQTHPEMKFDGGAYAYKIVRRKERSMYSVLAGKPLRPDSLGVRPRHAGANICLSAQWQALRPRFLPRAQESGSHLALRARPQFFDRGGRAEMEGSDIKDCFGCHATNIASSSGDVRAQLDKLVPGVRCEACHGPGERHVTAMRAGNFKEKQLTNLRTLNTEDQLNFCGACHRTWEQVMLLPNRGGIDNVRFQPYRLTNSACYDTEDRRISCTACHDPHEEVRREPAFYDAKCTSCHSQSATVASNRAAASGHAQRRAPSCPTGKQQCVTCHMPKVEVPGAHFKFTDHQIRVVKPNSPHPI
ncbi:MAG: multiheme c-type cytochrome [Pyrinomonadaceae bacterium]